MSTEDLLILSRCSGPARSSRRSPGSAAPCSPSLGARWFGIEALLAWFLLLNHGLSAALALRGRCAIAWRTLGTAILSINLVGLAGGTALTWAIDAERAKAMRA